MTDRYETPVTQTSSEGFSEVREEGAQRKARSAAKPPKMRSGKKMNIIAKAVIYAILALYALIIIFPFLIVIITSFKTWQDAVSSEFSWVPSMGFTFEGYLEVFTYKASPDSALPSLVNGFFNTLFYVLPPTILGLFTSSLSAYAFSKLRFRAKKWMYPLLLGTMMIPGTIMIVPQYVIYDSISWINTPLPLMIPGMFGAAACVFFMRQFYAGIPDSLIEASKLDGLGYFGIFFRIMVPLSVPALLAQGLLGFIGGYNDYLGPLLYLHEDHLYTLQVALNNIADTYERRSNVVMAASIVALVPMLIVYFFTQRFFISGIVSSGLKD